MSNSIVVREGDVFYTRLRTTWGVETQTLEKHQVTKVTPLTFVIDDKYRTKLTGAWIEGDHVWWRITGISFYRATPALDAEYAEGEARVLHLRAYNDVIATVRAGSRKDLEDILARRVRSPEGRAWIEELVALLRRLPEAKGVSLDG